MAATQNAEWATVSQQLQNWQMHTPVVAQTVVTQTGSVMRSLAADPGFYVALVVLGWVILTWPVKKKGA